VFEGKQALRLRHLRLLAALLLALPKCLQDQPLFVGSDTPSLLAYSFRIRLREPDTRSNFVPGP
jgi:hypothetical protein